MNINAMMKQAQQLQNKLLAEKKAIDEKCFEGKSSLVTVVMTGDKKLKDVKINMDELTGDDVEILQDMILNLILMMKLVFLVHKGQYYNSCSNQA